MLKSRNIYFLYFCLIFLVLHFGGKAIAQTTSSHPSSQMYRLHQIRSGENIDAIAETYNINPNSLYICNQLAEDPFIPGNFLLIPLEVSFDATMGQEDVFEHQVQVHESLNSISRQYNIDIFEIKTLNGLSSNRVPPGTILKIPSVATNTFSINRWIVRLHEVMEAENLSTIAQRYQVSIKDIQKINDLTNNTISAGQFLKVPIYTEAHQLLHQEEPFIIHTVDAGEQLSQIAHNNNIELAELKTLNNLSGNQINEGALIVIPNKLPPKSNSLSKRLFYSTYLGLSQYASNDWEGNNRFSYAVNLRFRSTYDIFASKYRNLTGVQVALGVRHELGDRLQKSLDRFEVKNKFSYYPADWLDLTSHTSFRSQFFDTYIHNSSGESTLTAAMFTPAYFIKSFGFTLDKNPFSITFNFLEFKYTFVLNQEIYETRTTAFGVPAGEKMFLERGVSVRASIYYYKDEKLKLETNIYSFYNKNGIDFEVFSTFSYRVSRRFKIAVDTEIFYDLDAADFMQFKNEVLFAFTLTKRKTYKN